MPQESFQIIPAYANYEVSTHGRVRRVSTGRIMKLVDNGKGYKCVKLYNEHRPQGRLCLVHRLVLSTFAPTDSDLDVNHRDGDKGNNTLLNLEWVTKSENTRHAHMTGLFAGRNKLTITQVREIKARIALAQRETYQAISLDYGVRASIISKIAHGQLYSYV